MISIKLKNRRFFKKAVIIVLSIFTITQTAGTAFGAGLLPGFYGDPSKGVIAPNINSLPSLKNIVQGVSSLENIGNNQLIIHQNQSNAIIEWDSFDIGANGWVHYNQQNNSAWKVLNRIFDNDPSLIYGRLTADGHVYLINQNGIFFSPGSRVNVGSLVASSLNISDSDFITGNRKFGRENYIFPGELLNTEGVVSNHGIINTAQYGSLFLLGTHVENNGEISAFIGWAGLAAGEKVNIYQDSKENIISNIVSVENGGEVTNYVDGIINADLGQAGMYGSTVTQDGTIQALTAVRKNGKIELLATDRVILGKESITSSPIIDSAEKVHESFVFTGGQIKIAGTDINNPLKRIEGYGIIEAPAGTIELKASERIYIGEDAGIDAGGLWVQKPVSEKLIDVQLNSVELRDDYGQKGEGGVLKGDTVTISSLQGSSIGNVSSHFSQDERTASEMAVKGGTITLNAGFGDIILREGSLIDASGGGVEYLDGAYNTTKLVSANNVVYDISNAPQWESYEGILGDFKYVNERYGTTKYSGVYYGGVAPLVNYSAGFLEGANAGGVTLIGSKLALDGMVDLSVTQGKYQLLYPDASNKTLYEAMGISVPEAGTLKIGDDIKVGFASSIMYPAFDPFVQEIVLSGSVEILPDSFRPNDPFPEHRNGISYISSDLLSSSGAYSIGLYTRAGISIFEDAVVSLQPGGTFEVTARKIQYEGDLTIPGGNIKLYLKSNITTDPSIAGQINPEYISHEAIGDERVHLLPGSSISVAGEIINNSMYGNNNIFDYEKGLLKGGSIVLSDESFNGEGVVVSEGAFIDISGGVETNNKGHISGGDAGALTIHGLTVLLDGSVAGYSAIGKEGGSISVHAGDISIVSHNSSSGVNTIEQEIPSELFGRFNIDDNYFDETGIVHFILLSSKGIHVEKGTSFSPSPIKIISKREDIAAAAEIDIFSVKRFNDPAISLISAPDIYIGDSSITFNTGEVFDGVVVDVVSSSEEILQIGEDALLRVFQEGSINLDGLNINISGALDAPGGAIGLNAVDINMAPGALLSVKGYDNPATSPLISGLPVGRDVFDGGSVKIKADNLSTEAGSVIDISGSEAVTNYSWGVDGKILHLTEAGAPGILNIEYFNEPKLEGDIRAEAGLANLPGASLSLVSSNTSQSMKIVRKELSAFITQGFDSIALKSAHSINFIDSMNVSIGRLLSLDAPVIDAAPVSEIKISSPWITLKNSYEYYAGRYSSISGSSLLTLDAGILDINGFITLSSFERVELNAAQDIRLSDYYYYNSTGGLAGRWGGILQSGDLVLNADRIYPETLSSFSIRATGDITVNDNGDNLNGPIYSAGANLELTGANIYHYGDIYAPLGSITLKTSGDAGRIFLGDGSTLSTNTSAHINYGIFDDSGIIWGLKKDDGGIDPDKPVESAPSGSVFVQANEVIAVGGSDIDVSGGGELFGYKFLPGTEGSNDPLKKSRQYVILPDNSVPNPGKTIIIDTNREIPAGEYYLLSEEYAFTEGAIILTDLGTGYNPEQYHTTSQGYTVITGKNAVAGTAIEDSGVRFYSLREAKDLLTEGYFEIRNIVAGDGGNITLKGNTTFIEGNIIGNPLSDEYKGGELNLSGKNILVTAAGSENESSLPENFDPAGSLAGQLSDDLLNRLVVADASVSGRGMENIILGDTATTDNIELEEGVDLNVKAIQLNARDAINIKGNANVAALSGSGDGVITFNSPQGKLLVENNAQVHASDNITINTGYFDIKGEFIVDNSSLNITSKKIFFMPNDYTDRSEAGGYITQSLWDMLKKSDYITLGYGSEITFKDAFNLNIASGLTIDASLISGSGKKVDIKSAEITFQNSGSLWGGAFDKGAGEFYISADKITLNMGVVTFDGYSQINLLSDNTFFQGRGSLVTGGADLSIKSRGLLSSAYKTQNTYNVMDYMINAGKGSVAILSGAYSANNVNVEPSSGGRFEIRAENITQSGMLNMPGSYILFDAAGAEEGDGIFLIENAAIVSSGDAYSPAGRIRLASGKGVVSLEEGTILDVSAGAQGDAGTIEIYSPAKAAVIDGYLLGMAKDNGAKGSFTIDTAAINDLGVLSNTLYQGGLTGKLDIRAREGNMILESDASIYGDHITLSADGLDSEGNIDIYGALVSTNNTEKGWIGIYAANDLTLHTNSSIGLTSGGKAVLSSMKIVTFDEGAAISGGESILFRSLRDDAGVNISLKGSVTGTDTVTVEAVRIYNAKDHDGIINSEIALWKTETANYMQTAPEKKETVYKDLITGPGTSLYYAPGIEVQSQGDLSIEMEWDLTGWRYDVDQDGSAETAGSLYLRAAGNLNINANIKDAPTNKQELWKDSNVKSWNLNFSAGSDLSVADPSAWNHNTASGNLEIKSKALIYTERGSLGFSSAGDTTINQINLNSMVTSGNIGFNLATYSGDIRGDVGGSLYLKGGAVQSSTGDITFNILNGLSLTRSNNILGAVRSLGAPPESGLNKYTEYGRGGNVFINSGGQIEAIPTKNDAWDAVYRVRDSVSMTLQDVWAASYDGGISGRDASQGIVAMSGGDIRVKAGKEITAGIGIFGKGDLEVYSGGDLNGRFLISEGAGELYAAGDFGTRSNLKNQHIELFDAQLSLAAGGKIELGTIVNPTLAKMGFTTPSSWNLGYTTSTSVNLNALNNDIILTGNTVFYDKNIQNAQKQNLLPASLSFTAGRDIIFNSTFFIAPSPTGNLLLRAGNDISGAGLDISPNKKASIYMSDIDPAQIYGNIRGLNSAGDVNNLILLLQSGHSAGVLHINDYTPVTIEAGRDINKILLYLPKETRITAGRDIRDIYYSGQNTRGSDLSIISAERDIFFSSGIVNPFQSGILHGGPGTLLVRAGNSIDLGTTDGIQLIGNQFNPYLGREDNDLVLLSGINRDLTLAAVKKLFGSDINYKYTDIPADIKSVADTYIRLMAERKYSEAEELAAQFGIEQDTAAYNAYLSAGEDGKAETLINQTRDRMIILQLTGRYLEYFDKNMDYEADSLVAGLNIQLAGAIYSKILAEGKKDEAEDLVNRAREMISDPLLNEYISGPGNIDMVESQISITGSEGGIYMAAMGDINVGKTTFSRPGSAAKNSGIFTASGGSLNILSKGDLNVNESRIMTFAGGDITVWSDKGNINAGRGSKTSINATESVAVYDQVSGTWSIEFKPPAVGSGIRSLTFDPDGLEGPKQEPLPGDVYLFAPEGEIDAGEAGISGSNVILGATEIVNAQNINFSQGSVGLPVTTTAINMGALSAGASSLTDTAGMADNATSSLAGERDQAMQDAMKALEDFIAKWLSVEVIGFYVD
ncbi:MAG: filamentous hemagglutinin family protein [Deltaproteobacteria bacterium]|nr:filamentous hemagglutinin family protein [Deltaproteobacteria bacterium]